MVKFLIIRFSSIGDIVMTTPVIRGLKKEVEGAEIHYVTKKQYLPVLEANPYIDKIHLLSDNIVLLKKELREEAFDYVIDLHNNIRSSRIKSAVRRMAFTVDKINFKKYMAVRFKKINKLPDKHFVDRYLETVKVFDVKYDENGLDYFIPDKDRVSMQSFPSEFQSGYLGFVIGAKHNTKKYPLEKIIKVCKNITYPIILLGGKDDEDFGNKIISNTSGTIYNACGQYNISQSASLVEQAKLIITNDTGLMHIAAAFKKTIISIWGSTIPEFGNYPFSPANDSIMLGIENLKCRPCSKIGHTECPKKHFKCMIDIDENKIVELVQKKLNATL